MKWIALAFAILSTTAGAQEATTPPPAIVPIPIATPSTVPPPAVTTTATIPPPRPHITPVHVNPQPLRVHNPAVPIARLSACGTVAQAGDIAAVNNAPANPVRGGAVGTATGTTEWPVFCTSSGWVYF